MNSETEAFVSNIASKYEALTRAFQEHLDDNLGETLPHVLMSEYCRKVLASTLDEPWVGSFLSQLEDNFSLITDDDVSNLIAVSFIEHLPPPSSNHSIVGKLGGKMKRQYNMSFGSS